MTIGGMEVVTSADANIGRSAAVRARLGLALELIDQYAPRIGARLRRDVIALYIARSGGIGYNLYAHDINVDVRSGMSGEFEDLAIALVHEATHARQIAMGVRKRPNDKFERRMEAHAVAESIAFAERLPPGAWTKPTLASLDTHWWSWERRAERITEAARDGGLPAWPILAVVRALRLVGLVR
jgi:hypothetical protein